MKVIDLFAGAGGFSEGARMAGAQVVWAANHWPLAVRYHKLNHPETVHVCQDLHQADWSLVPQHDVVLASPACQGHSRARGRERPHHDAQRSTAWAVVSCLEHHRSSVCVVENVPDFKNWALYPSWQDAVGRLGYAVAPHIVDAADHGVPQHRVRLFLVLTRSKRPLRLALPNRPHKPVSEIIEWDRHKWTPIFSDRRSPKTIARVRAGRSRYGDRFVMPYYSSGSGLTGRSVDRPIGTISTVDRWAIVRGDAMRMFQVGEVRSAMGFPASYRLPETKRDAVHLLGNAVAPLVSSDIVEAIRRAA